jgi:uncharacterized membrane protein YidH (DUF202 family)
MGKGKERASTRQGARVEPKSYFANERTFIQWISAALLQVTVAVILLEYAGQHPEYPLVPVGLMLCGAGGCVIAYALFAYHRRVTLLTDGKPYGYIDHLGPTFLAVTIIVGVLALTIIVAQGPLEENLPFQATLQQQSGFCAQHSATGLSSLEYEPSDILVDTSRNMLLVPSLATIRAYDLPSATLVRDDPVVSKILVEVPGANLEGLTMVEDRVFALSESVINDGGPSQLIELGWTTSSSGTSTLQVLQQWTIPTPQAEGIAYVPGGNGGVGKLYIAGDLSRSQQNFPPNQRGSLDLYDLPPRVLNNSATPPSDSMSLRPTSVNAKTLNQGLLDSKIGSLQFFEGMLYVLHDNAIVVRVWDIQAGELKAEWPLPFVGGGFDKQWEGMWLERWPLSVPERKTRNLRGNAATRLLDEEDIDDDEVTQTETTPDQESAVQVEPALNEEPINDVLDTNPERVGGSTLILHLALDTPPQVWSFAVEEGSSPGIIQFPDCAAA